MKRCRQQGLLVGERGEGRTWTSQMTKMGSVWQYCSIRWLIDRSASRILGPVLYQPTMFSRAAACRLSVYFRACPRWLWVMRTMRKSQHRPPRTPGNWDAACMWPQRCHYAAARVWTS